MTAELLRDAAEVLRERANSVRRPFGPQEKVDTALAKWLDDIAAGWVWDEDPEDIETPDGWPLTLEESMDSHALTIARLILGGAS
ncbi:hypothetical protein [Terrabacter sp. C0L_2]|uniref:hypothetical protein n=1 Tax=Terrabacter sp. C0L_2 TaxID=3108389 RepID=UPI002ED0C96C|nr:hypothetical protein U5C87_17605 [Terrabacter sp. C0L_2]